MIRWYCDLYTDEEVGKNIDKCKKRVTRRRPWKKNYYALMLAQNPQNLFEIVGTREFFFRRYGYTDLFIIGLSTNYSGAVKILQQIAERYSREGTKKSMRELFNKDDFE